MFEPTSTPSPRARRPRAHLVLFVAALVFAVACGDDSGSAATESSSDLTGFLGTSSTTTSSTATSSTATSSTTWPDRSQTHHRQEVPAPDIEVLDPGAEPRAPLRLRLVAGDTQRVTAEFMEARQLHVEGLGSGEESEVLYAIDMDLVVASVHGNRATVELTYRDIRLIDPGLAAEEDIAAFRAIADGAIGITIYSLMDDRGITHLYDSPRSAGGPADDPAGLGYDVPEIMLPAEPVGVGARWRMTLGPSMESGALATTIVDYELVEVHDDRLVINQMAVTTSEATSVDGVDYGTGNSNVGGTLTWYLSDPMATGTLEGAGRFPFTSAEYGPDHPAEIVTRSRTTVTVER